MCLDCMNQISRNKPSVLSLCSQMICNEISFLLSSQIQTVIDRSTKLITKITYYGNVFTGSLFITLKHHIDLQNSISVLRKDLYAILFGSFVTFFRCTS